MNADYTLEELLICRMAKEYRGERIAAAVTILAEISARLAKALYEPDLILVSGGSQGAFDGSIGSEFAIAEWTSGNDATMSIPWPDMFQLIAQDKLQIFMGPVQLDKHGNANISVVGPWASPKIQLIGARGLPDDLWGNERFMFHVRRHTKRSFVDKVDFVCSLGYGPERDRLGLKSGLPSMAISDLGVFGWNPQTGHMLIETLHPGVTFEQVQEATGFKWPEADGTKFPVTAAPTQDELHWIREKIDPRGWRRTEANQAPANPIDLISDEIEMLKSRRPT